LGSLSNGLPTSGLSVEMPSNRDQYVKNLKRLLPTLIFILNKKKLTPQLAKRMSPALLKLLRDIFRNVAEPHGYLHKTALKDKQICQCMDVFKSVSDCKSPKHIKRVITQSGGIALPVGLLAMALPSLVSLISGAFNRQ
jgi:hypothetical protein